MQFYCVDIIFQMSISILDDDDDDDDDDSRICSRWCWFSQLFSHHKWGI